MHETGDPGKFFLNRCNFEKANHSNLSLFNTPWFQLWSLHSFKYFNQVRCYFNLETIRRLYHNTCMSGVQNANFDDVSEDAKPKRYQILWSQFSIKSPGLVAPCGASKVHLLSILSSFFQIVTIAWRHIATFVTT